MMDSDEICEALERRREQFNEVGAKAALGETVDTDRFYKYIGSITDVEVSESEVHVSFHEPAPGVSDLDSGYEYTVAVSRESFITGYQRAGMPRNELITLQQVAITIWAMATGEMY